MTKQYGARRNRSPGFRPLNEESDTERYKRLGWDPRKTYEENMGYEDMFDRPDEELDWPGFDLTPRRKPSPAVRDLAAEGRGEDTEIAHLTPGELVVPRALQTPEFMAALEQAAAAHGIPLEMLSIGNRMNRINPNTGAPEFGVGTDITAPDLGSFQNYTPDVPALEIIPPTDSSPQQAYPGIGTALMPLDPVDRGIPADGFGSFTYGPQQTRVALPGQAAAWPHDYSGNMGTGRAYRPPNDRDHNGVDLRNRLNDPVYSAVDGQVVGIGKEKRSGSHIFVQDKYGNLYGFAHSGAIDGLSPGQTVKAGQQIGFSDGSGSNRAGEPVPPHLHMTFRRGTPEFPATRQTPDSDPGLLFYNLGGLRRKP